MFPMISADRTTSELLFYRHYLTLTSLRFLGSEVRSRSLVGCSKCFPTQQRIFPGRQKIFVSVATVIQEVFVPIGVPEK